MFTFCGLYFVVSSLQVGFLHQSSPLEEWWFGLDSKYISVPGIFWFRIWSQPATLELITLSFFRVVEQEIFQVERRFFSQLNLLNNQVNKVHDQQQRAHPSHSYAAAQSPYSKLTCSCSYIVYCQTSKLQRATMPRSSI